MATIVLQTAGAAIGGALGGPIGAVIGQALGAAAGGAIDQRLFGPGDQHVEGPRLDATRYLSSGEGNAIPRLYGTSRIAGEIIWATRFQEVISKKKVKGGKGSSPKTTVSEYSYFANFAIGLCEGEIGGISRIWADGSRVQHGDLTFRVYRGTQNQMPDALIETKQGAGNASAFRGTAYIVFENFPLENYGNRIPQISVEVIKPAGALERTIKAVNLIPGASEFAYDVDPVVESNGEISAKSLNVHQFEGETDFLASLDVLQATCPNLEQISLVVAWFGDDLRAGLCRIRPKVEVASRSLISGEDWYAGGLPRSVAQLVSKIDGRPALGGTPSDGSVIRAIQEIKSRGLRVAITPFLMMDVASNNGLPDPYGGAQQGAYPWRGRITSSAGPDTALSANRTEIGSFVGSTTVTQVGLSDTDSLALVESEWCYRRMILHYAKIAQVAGGVDQFLIGSEMRGLTALRDQSDAFPFVEALVQLAADVRPLLGANCLVSYAADWSEYFHYKPNDGSQDLFYNLDPLWASADIDAIAIDNYFPISDFRPEGENPDIGRSDSDPDYLKSAMEGGEGFEWYYASSADRQAQVRTQITDGLGKPWTFRYKDIRSWIGNQHFERRNGVELAAPTAWQPNSKPVMFAELGAPAVHNAATRPNVFPDPKSSEDALPYFSNGGRDDMVQAAYLEAFLAYWDQEHPDYQAGTNPNVVANGKPLIDMARCQMWAWDARPYPAFPNQSDVWSDGENWVRGHWLNGRLGRLRLADLIADLMTEAGISNVDTRQVYGVVDGFVLAQQTSARQALEALIDVYRIEVLERDGFFVFLSPGADPVLELGSDQFVIEKESPATIRNRGQSDDIPGSVSLSHLERSKDYQATKTEVKIAFGNSQNEQQVSLPVTAMASELMPVLENWLKAKVTARDTIQFSLSQAQTALTVGDVVRFSDVSPERLWRLAEITEGDKLECSAVAVRPNSLLPAPVQALEPIPVNEPQGRYLVTFLDLPVLPFGDGLEANRVAVASNPWDRPATLYSGRDDGVYTYLQTITAPATIGELSQPLPATLVTSRWQPTASINVTLYDGDLSSAAKHTVFNGANAVAVGSKSDGWEVIQFLSAEPLGNNQWRLSGLLRGQAGTEDLAQQTKVQGTRIVILDGAIEPLSGSDEQLGREYQWTVGPLGAPLASSRFVELTYQPGIRHLLPLRPAHFCAGFTPTDGLTLSWTRRERTGGDNWEFVDIAMSEASERYEMRAVSGSEQRTWTTTSPTLAIDIPELNQWLGGGGHILDLSVSQISEAVGPGLSASTSLSIQL